MRSHWKMAWIAPLLTAGCSEFNLQHIGDAEPGATAGPEASVSPEPVEGPLLELEPAQHHFDGGCADEVEITVRNVGTEDAVLDDLVYQSGGELTLLDEALRSQLPLVMPPGGEGRVTIAWDPRGTFADDGVLEVHSNDPRGVRTAAQSGLAVGEHRVEAFEGPGQGGAVDVMLLIDQSCSMEEDNIGDVRLGLPGFLAELQATADWHLVEIVSDTGCAQGGVIDPSVPNPEQLLVDNAFPSGPTILIGNRTEALLQLASIALSQAGPGQCNEGFLRPGAMLNVMVLTDEKERSGRPYTHWLGEISSYLGAPDQLVVSAIVDENRRCGDGSGAVGYLGAAADTGGPVLDICSPDWGSQLPAFATDVLEGVGGYVLADEPVEGTVEVWVDGELATDVEVVGRTVTIHAPEVVEGAEVEIAYDAGPGCAAQ